MTKERKVIPLVTKAERESHARALVDMSLRRAAALADLARTEIGLVQQAMDHGHAFRIDPNDLAALERALASTAADIELLRRRLAHEEEGKQP